MSSSGDASPSPTLRPREMRRKLRDTEDIITQKADECRVCHRVLKESV